MRTKTFTYANSRHTRVVIENLEVWVIKALQSAERHSLIELYPRRCNQRKIRRCKQVLGAITVIKSIYDGEFG